MTLALMMAATLKVLTIGNSFSVQMVNSMPPIAADLGLELDICSLYIGGCPLERHWNNVLAPETKPYAVTRNRFGEKMPSVKGNIPEWLQAEKWDVVTIQQASKASWDPKTYQPFADNLIAKIRELAPQAEIVVHETWSYCDTEQKGSQRMAGWGLDSKKMYAALHSAYAALAKKYRLRVIPTGTAAIRFPDRARLFKDTHFNENGNHLQALVWTAKLFGVDVMRCRYVPAGIDPAVAAEMRRVAQETVTGKRCALEVDFSRGAWNPADFIVAKSSKKTYLGAFDQKDDCIVNRCPAGHTPEEIAKLRPDPTYASLVFTNEFSYGTTVSSTMGWDWEMAPLILITPELYKDEEGRPTFGEHWEVVVYKQGINIWHHFLRDGQMVYEKSAALALPKELYFKANEKHDLAVTIGRTWKGDRLIEASCGGFTVACVDPTLPDKFYVGVTGCEGRNFFWNMRVLEKPVKGASK